MAVESALERAEREAVALGHHDVTAEHILLGLMNEDNRAVRLLGTFGVDPTAVCDAAMPFLPAPGRALSSLTPEPQAAGAPAASRSRGERQAKPMITALSAEQAENFAILRRPETDKDRLPEERQERLRTGLVARQGLNPALARRVRTSIGDVWIIPGNGTIDRARHGDLDINPLPRAGHRPRARSRRSAGGHPHSIQRHYHDHRRQGQRLRRDARRALHGGLGDHAAGQRRQGILTRSTNPAPRLTGASEIQRSRPDLPHLSLSHFSCEPSPVDPDPAVSSQSTLGD